MDTVGQYTFSIASNSNTWFPNAFAGILIFQSKLSVHADVKIKRIDNDYVLHQQMLLALRHIPRSGGVQCDTIELETSCRY